MYIDNTRLTYLIDLEEVNVLLSDTSLLEDFGDGECRSNTATKLAQINCTTCDLPHYFRWYTNHGRNDEFTENS